MRTASTPWLAWLLFLGLISVAPAQELPGTQRLTEGGDLAARMVEGIDQYLTRELAASVAHRQARWKIDDASLEAYRKSVEPQRQRLRKILGVIDPRVATANIEIIGTVGQL